MILCPFDQTLKNILFLNDPAQPRFKWDDKLILCKKSENFHERFRKKKLRKRINRWRYFIGPSPPLQVLLSVQSKCWKITTRITPNTNTFHAALMGSNTKTKILMPMFPLYKSQDRLTFFFILLQKTFYENKISASHQFYSSNVKKWSKLKWKISPKQNS